ncbi:MAG: VOC family protein [Acidobacteria bacterium]|nr:VOC family protein [Acidobacteriota bacterium]
MAVELDHLFICTSGGAPEVDQLIAFGLTEGQPNTHPGQGTACRRFFFRNAYLEFLWVRDAEEAQSEPAAALGLWQRCLYRQTDSSPFGLGLRPPAAKGHVELPFEAWPYCPSWLPTPLRIDVAESATRTAEPLLFYASFFARPDSYPVERRQPLVHAAGFGEITGLMITLPNVTSRSESRAGVGRAGVAEFVVGGSHLAEVTFDEGRQGEAYDFRPGLPLLFRW